MNLLEFKHENLFRYAFHGFIFIFNCANILQYLSKIKNSKSIYFYLRIFEIFSENKQNNQNTYLNLFECFGQILKTNVDLLSVVLTCNLQSEFLILCFGTMHTFVLLRNNKMVKW